MFSPHELGEIAETDLFRETDQKPSGRRILVPFGIQRADAAGSLEIKAGGFIAEPQPSRNPKTPP